MPWDGWGLAADQVDERSPEELALLDRVAELTQAKDSAHEEVQKLYHSEVRLRIPRIITSFGPGGNAPIDLGPGITD